MLLILSLSSFFTNGNNNNNSNKSDSLCKYSRNRVNRSGQVGILCATLVIKSIWSHLCVKNNKTKPKSTVHVYMHSCCKYLYIIGIITVYTELRCILAQTQTYIPSYPCACINKIPSSIYAASVNCFNYYLGISDTWSLIYVVTLGMKEAAWELLPFLLAGEVIKAWDLGVATMKKGEIARFTCRSEYAYGERGSPPKIPPNATLIFEVRRVPSLRNILPFVLFV